MVVAQMYLWLTLFDFPDCVFDEPVSAAGLFGPSLEAMQARFDLRKKQSPHLALTGLPLLCRPARERRPRLL